MTKREINAALRRAGLPVEVQNNGDGYSYFTSTLDGSQVGDSVYVPFLKDQTVEEWVEDARRELAREEERKLNRPFPLTPSGRLRI